MGFPPGFIRLHDWQGQSLDSPPASSHRAPFFLRGFPAILTTLRRLNTSIALLARSVTMPMRRWSDSSSPFRAAALSAIACSASGPSAALRTVIQSPAISPCRRPGMIRRGDDLCVAGPTPLFVSSESISARTLWIRATARISRYRRCRRLRVLASRACSRTTFCLVRIAIPLWYGNFRQLERLCLVVVAT